MESDYRKLRSLVSPFRLCNIVRIPLPYFCLTFLEVITESKKSWLKDSVALKAESEKLLQDYFKNKLAEDSDSNDETDDWVVAKPKKRRIR